MCMQIKKPLRWTPPVEAKLAVWDHRMRPPLLFLILRPLAAERRREKERGEREGDSHCALEGGSEEEEEEAK